jgi:hypothetical protein
METHSIPNNLIITVISGAPYFVAFLSDNLTPLTGIILPCLFFLIGKGIDIFLRIYLDNKRRK